MDKRRALHRTLALAALFAAGAASARGETGAENAGASVARAFFRAVTVMVRVEDPTRALPRSTAAGVRG